MTMIKNGKELVLRADGHAKWDRLEQGTYGHVETDGDSPVYKGCAIGCLSTPHRKADLRRFLGKHTAHGDWLDLDSEQMVTALEEQFGIGLELARLGELLFEAAPTHGAAIELIPAFARAVASREGTSIDKEEVQKITAAMMNSAFFQVGSRFDMDSVERVVRRGFVHCRDTVLSAITEARYARQEVAA